ncbi:aspartyl-tRNA(Asn)/glutamyl-tRNA(Gln) amidotransferase subunit A [Pullulanibacillus pueri]|uniref:Glutamyl-tRNA(Gln) amidotransferase subunit A n=1 Tax=Pullulanibacillus pueri TaxID=1437324 RepID=A0A8J2ZWE0_9BACL|nr:Asp-tRNA(Asn)/Glu-tRNA(Gln) amidotransferase subunit GatA [Pullulanibacillus pueri]MBM7682738.1 aspartyl-tRNA(Asn)/glutamyl-tRNA(Gln) amidotransferase subunit A [Pullulanibacillus pueri]GGH82995.1 glutamyl-tRNA(Gln) amidotransferase subunit A [Pullulanibacillus pueri]
MALFDEGYKSIHDRLHKKDLSVTELVEESYKNIQKTDASIHAFLTLNKEAALEKAKALDAERGNADAALFGLPIGVKDNIVTKNLKTTAASQILANFEPLHNATVVEKINAQNGIVIGKLNMDEFAMGSSNENSSYFKTLNPWDLTRVPGGSSGGSAAAVSAGMVPYSLGSDTGGSIRQPAAFCGVVGMKPTYGRVSRFGLIAFASSLDQIGPFTRNVEDNAHLLQAISGVDVYDSTSANVDVPDFTKALTGEVKGLRVAVPKEYFGEGVSEEVKTTVKKAIAQLESLGAVVEEVSLPHSKYAVAAYYIIASSEASANLARFDGVRYGVRAAADNLIDMYKKTRSEGFGEEVKRRIMLGTFALSSGYYDAYYKKAQKVRTLIKRDFEKVFENYDVVIGPTTPTTAFKIGEKIDDPLTMYANDILTIPVNLAGVPAISVPCGLANGLPVGLQIIGKPFDEATIYRTAHAYEQAANLKLTPALEGVNA